MEIGKMYSPYTFLVRFSLAGAFLPIALLLCTYALSVRADVMPEQNWFRGFLDKCYAIENADLRLECYDTLAKTTRANEKRDNENNRDVSKKQSIQKPPQQLLQQSPKNDAEQQFGLSSKLKKTLEPNTKISITAHVVNVSQSKRNVRIFYFDNGQIWKQTKADYIAIPKGDKFSVVISRGAVGDYRLRVNGKGKMTRVKRIN